MRCCTSSSPSALGHDPGAPCACAELISSSFWQNATPSPTEAKMLRDPELRQLAEAFIEAQERASADVYEILDLLELELTDV